MPIRGRHLGKVLAQPSHCAARRVVLFRLLVQPDGRQTASPSWAFALHRVVRRVCLTPTHHAGCPPSTASERHRSRSHTCVRAWRTEAIPPRLAIPGLASLEPAEPCSQRSRVDEESPAGTTDTAQAPTELGINSVSHFVAHDCTQLQTRRRWVIMTRRGEVPELVDPTTRVRVAFPHAGSVVSLSCDHRRRGVECRRGERAGGEPVSLHHGRVLGPPVSRAAGAGQNGVRGPGGG